MGDGFVAARMILEHVALRLMERGDHDRNVRTIAQRADLEEILPMPESGKIEGGLDATEIVPSASPEVSITSAARALGVKAQAVWNAITSLGPRALALWPAGSKNLLRHDLGKEAIAGWRQALDLENQNFAKIEEELLKQVIAASPAELIDIEQKLRFVREKRCQTSVVQKSLNYIDIVNPIQLPCGSGSDDSEGNNMHQAQASTDAQTCASKDLELQPVSDHWIDHFNDLARLRNEPWRAELLARALAAESSNPGGISLRALWSLGMLDEKVFLCFAALLNLCTVVSRGLVVPGDRRILAKPLGGDEGSPIKGRLGYITAVLTDAELIRLPPIHWHFAAGERVLASYGTTRFAIESSGRPFAVQGVMLTHVGKSLAAFHPRHQTKLGGEIFQEWIAGLDRSFITVEPI